MKINQFHSGSAKGDAITNQMLMIQELLRKKGFESDIYVEHIDVALKDRLCSIENYKGDKNSILIVHHSMGFDGFKRIISYPDKKVLIYHNITPECFFEDESTKKYIRLGLWQVEEYKKYIDYTIAASNFNRKELLKLGYQKVDVMPVQISLTRFEQIVSDIQTLNRLKTGTNILFVGRVVKNKKQEDIIRAFSVYHRVFDTESRLIIVGDTGGGYVEELIALAKTLKVDGAVEFPGKVSEETLKAYYQSADLFLCMSEHEGFGVPLLEAMVMGVPVMAFSSSAIPETMGGAGILLLNKDFLETAALMKEVIKDPQFHEQLVKKQYERIEKMKNTNTEKILMNAILNIQNGGRVRTIQMQGPFETSYSLAIVNKKLAQAFDDIGHDNVSIYCTEGPGDYLPEEKNLIDKPHAKRLWEKSKNIPYPDVTIRNMYPPRVADANGGMNFLSFAWEEDVIPEQYVTQFNRYLSGIGTTSNFVTEALKRSGVHIPITTIGNGVELLAGFDSLCPYKLLTRKKLKFLHISSAFPRKGVDILLNAYFSAFNSTDDICLVLKTFPNPHNQIEDILGGLRRKHPDGPEVEWINCDLSEQDLYSLYKSADCYVHVARGEGFGLPVAEAMLAKCPVIVSPNSGMADFCNEDTASLVPYTMEVAHAHLSSNSSQWACPDENILAQCMRDFFENPSTDHISQRLKNAYELISTHFTWEAVANRWVGFIDEVAAYQFRPKVAMVTTWNSKCGIAEYTRFQCEAMNQMAEFLIYPNYGVSLLHPDEKNVCNRLWDSAFHSDLDALTQSLLQSSEKIVHFQFNFGFFNLQHLATSIIRLHQYKKIVITFHKTKDADVGGTMVSLASITEALNLCYQLIVHQQEDKDILVGFGINKNLISIIPHGQIKYQNREKNQLKKELGINRSLVLGSYGFLLPHKGILENIQALKLIKEQYPDALYIVCCALHEAVESTDYYQTCINQVKVLDLEENVVFVTDFLKLDESIVLLQACDILLMTYLPTEESASGAVRFCVAANRPLITTKQKIFEEFSTCTIQIPFAAERTIQEAVCKVASMDCTALMAEMESYRQATSWEAVSEKFNVIYHSALTE